MIQSSRLGLGAALLVGLASCQSQSKHARDHWTSNSIGPSLSRHFLSYDAESDGNYTVFQWRKKKDMELSMRRHLLNNNPENPFEPYDPDFYAPRPPHSLVPAPWRYIHVEGLVFGFAAMAGGGAFIPIPIDSIIGTAEEGGTEEFMEGVGTTVRPLGQISASFLHDALGFPENNGDAWRHDAPPAGAGYTGPGAR